LEVGVDYVFVLQSTGSTILHHAPETDPSKARAASRKTQNDSIADQI
jgi:hypothetical protein